MHGNERGQEEPVMDGRANAGLQGEERKMTTAGREHEMEEEEDGEGGKSVITVRG